MTAIVMTNLDGLPNAAARADALASAHEAGHAVAREVLGLAYAAVKLADERGPAMVETPPFVRGNRTMVEREVLSALAGGVAEAMVFGRALPDEVAAGAIADMAFVRRVLGSRASNRSYVGKLLRRTQALVERNLPKIKRVARELLVKRMLTPDEVRTA